MVSNDLVIMDRDILEVLHVVSDVPGPARPESPGSGSAWEGLGSQDGEPEPNMWARARPGLGLG